jgi:Helix-turn-helix domain
MTSTPAAEQHLRDLARLRRVRDRIDREYAEPLDVEALARGVNMSAGHLSREFRRAYGESPYSYLMTRRIERAMALLRRGDLSVTRGVLRGRVLVAGHLQHPLHRAGRRAAQRLSARLGARGSMYVSCTLPRPSRLCSVSSATSPETGGDPPPAWVGLSIS